MNDGLYYVLIVAGIVFVAAFVVPFMAERIARRDAERRDDGWLHEHTDHEWREPPRGGPRDERRGKR